MLNFQGSHSRRSFLRIGGLAAGGLTLADILRLRANGAAESRKKSIIFVYLHGGPSHLDTFDMKPDAPLEYRGEFKSIRTTLPGLDICEHLPKMATICDKMALVRNMAFNPNFHDPVELMCGHRKPAESGAAIRPDFGSVVSRLRQGQRHELPAYVALDGEVGQNYRNGPAYLGLAHKAFIVRGNFDNFTLNRNVTPNRLQDRTALLREFDTMSREVDTFRGDMASADQFTAQAFDMITNPRVRDAFDVNREPARLRDAYGTGDGQKLLQARRLVEAGVPVVTLTLGERRGALETCSGSTWDTHRSNFRCLRELMLPMLDRAVHALITDIHDKGLSDDVLVFVGGEMGRTPRVGQSTGNGSTPDGRDHWVRAGFGMYFGGGLRMGQVIGRTDRIGGSPVGAPYSPQNMLSTLYRTIGIDPATTLPDFTGRPQFLVDDQRPIRELLA